MASVSFTVARGGLAEDILTTGAEPVTEGTAAPTTANTLQVRVDLASSWTKIQVREALERVIRYMEDPARSTGIPSV